MTANADGMTATSSARCGPCRGQPASSASPASSSQVRPASLSRGPATWSPEFEALLSEPTIRRTRAVTGLVAILEAPAFSLERLFPSGGFGEGSLFTPIFESEGLAISRSLCGELVPSKQVTRVRFPSPAPARIQRHNACVARAAEGRSPAFQADHRGSLGLLPGHFACPLAAPGPVELLIRRKDPGLLIRESWVRIPPGPPPVRCSNPRDD